MAEEGMELSAMLLVGFHDKSPATYKSPPIPTPPTTVNAPVAVFVDGVFADNAALWAPMEVASDNAPPVNLAVPSDNWFALISPEATTLTAPVKLPD